MDVHTAPKPTTTRTPPPSRPREWPPNVDISARRREAGHDDTRSRLVTPVAPTPVDTTAPAAGRHRLRVIHRRLTPPLDRARLMLLAAWFAAASAAAALPDHGDQRGWAASQRPTIAAVTPASTTASPCSPVAAGCCAGGTMTATDLVGALRPTCP